MVANMVSVKTAPESKSATSVPTIVSTGIRAFFKACRIITALSCNPFALAVRM